VYQFICKNGGWNNWDMIILEKVPCIDGNEARQHERRYIEDNNAMLNINIPTRESELKRKKEETESKKALKKAKQEFELKHKNEIITCECGIDIGRNNIHNHTMSVVHRYRMDAIHWVTQYPELLLKYSNMKIES
jgi:hypothetical protein